MLFRSGQCSCALSQTVTIRSTNSSIPGCIVLDACREMLMPISAIAATACGFNPCASIPADVTSHWPPDQCRANPSAICERQEFPVHRNRTFIQCFSHDADEPPRAGNARTDSTNGAKKARTCGWSERTSDAPSPSKTITPSCRTMKWSVTSKASAI